MPLRQDPSLWWNIPGVVAAYQPVRAPDSLLARYNMRHGGTSAYRAEPGVLPAWNAAKGWTGTGSQWLSSGYIPASNLQQHTLIARFSNLGNGAIAFLGFYNSVGGKNLLCITLAGSSFFYANGSSEATGGSKVTNGVLAVAGTGKYLNGVLIDNLAAGIPAGSVAPIYIMALSQNGATTQHLIGILQAAAIYSRTLTPAEVWLAYRQMAYCDVNPDWSVWSPRRKWFPYVLAGTGFQAAWAERANRLIGGG